MSETQTRTPPVSIFANIADEQYTRYAVTLGFHGKLMGGVPKSPKLIEAWIAKKAGITDEQELRKMVIRTIREQDIDLPVDIDETGEITDADYDAVKKAAETVAHEQQTTGFKRDAKGLYIESRQVKAMLREATNIGFASERWGATRKGPKAFLAERVFVIPDKIHLGRDQPDDTERVIGHVQDRLGKRSTLGYHEYVEDVSISFQIEVLDDAIETVNWPRIWVIAERNGLGALRSQGYGTFAVTEFRKLD